MKKDRKSKQPTLHIAELTNKEGQYYVLAWVLPNGKSCIKFQVVDKEIPTASSLLDYIFRYLQSKYGTPRNYPSIPNPGQYFYSGMLCPDCGSEAIHESGCLVCIKKCGWSRC